MISKRNVLLGGLAVTSLPAASWAQDSAPQSFSDLYSGVLADASLSEAERADTADKLADFETRAVAPRVKPSALKISDDAVKLIVLFEVTSAQLYDLRYQKPVWPGGDSGVTIGVGYDLGYVKPEWFDEDWGGRLDRTTLQRLRPSCGKRGETARLVYRQYADLKVPWVLASPQFREKLLPLYTGLAVSKLPQSVQSLHPDCLGALVSLVYNRGASFRSDKDRFREMKRIYNHLEDGELDQIPQSFLDMRRLWRGKPRMEGLVKRRELEAALFRQGLGKA